MTNEEMFRLLLDEVKGIKGEVKGIKDEVKGINERLTSLETKVNTIDNKLDDTIKFNQTTALDTVEYIHNKLATKDNVRRIDVKIDLINDRLFQQEATLKLVK